MNTKSMWQCVLIGAAIAPINFFVWCADDLPRVIFYSLCLTQGGLGFAGIYTAIVLRAQGQRTPDTVMGIMGGLVVLSGAILGAFLGYYFVNDHWSFG